MEVTLVQGLALMLMMFICAIDAQIEAFYWFRPIVVAFFAGIILGEVSLGAACGIVTDFAYLGMLNVLPVVIAGAALAGINYPYEKRSDEMKAAIEAAPVEDGDEDGI